MYNKFIARFSQDKSCPLCRRGFDDGQEEAQFLKQLKTIVGKIPQTVAVAEQEMTDSIQKRDQLQGLRSVWDDVKRISEGEIPKLRSSVSELQTTIRDLSAREMELSNEAIQMKEQLKVLTDLKIKSGELAKLKNDANVLEKEIHSLTTNLSMSGSVKTLDQVQTEYEEAQNKWYYRLEIPNDLAKSFEPRSKNATESIKANNVKFRQRNHSFERLQIKSRHAQKKSKIVKM
jgi:DNA repair protein RAD50